MHKINYRWFPVILSTGCLLGGLIGCVSQDSLESSTLPDIKALHQAAERGDRESQHQLARMYGMGLGVDHNAVEAEKWYRKSAEYGHPDALFYLGHAYEQGEGVTVDPVEAYKWYKLTLLAKEPPGTDKAFSTFRQETVTEKLNRLRQNLTLEQLKQAEDRVVAWQTQQRNKKPGTIE